MGIAERHLDRRMSGEFLDGSDRDAAEGKPRTKSVTQVVESEILNLRPVDRSIERILDVGDGLSLERSVQVNKDVSVRASLLMDGLELL